MESNRFFDDFFFRFFLRPTAINDSERFLWPTLLAHYLTRLFLRDTATLELIAAKRKKHAPNCSTTLDIAQKHLLTLSRCLLHQLFAKWNALIFLSSASSQRLLGGELRSKACSHDICMERCCAQRNIFCQSSADSMRPNGKGKHQHQTPTDGCERFKMPATGMWIACG